MSTLNNIDINLPITFYACVAKEITDPEMVELAGRMQLPGLLWASYPLAGAEIIFQDGVDIFNWLRSSPRWRSKIEETLQCLADDAEGKPLITSFMPIDDLIMLAQELNDNRVWDLRSPFTEWKAMGATEGCFEGYKI